MINKNELIFAVDENNNPIQSVERQQAHKEGIWHRTTDIAVVNSKNEILVHKRSMLKDNGPGLWDCCFGGHILAETDATSSAIQELEEESGLKVSPDEIHFLTVVKHEANDSNKEFRYAYVYRWNGDINQLKLEKDEIDEVRWVSLDVIKSNRDNRAEWVSMPYLDELLKYLKI